MTTEASAAAAQMSDDDLRALIRDELHGQGKSTKARFDGTINLGHVLSMTTILLTLIVGGATFHSRLTVVEAQMARQTEILERTIRADEQMRALRERLDRLERGK